MANKSPAQLDAEIAAVLNNPVSVTAMTTERLDELCAMAREVGRTAAILATAEHVYEWGTPASRRDQRWALLAARKAAKHAEKTYAWARTRLAAKAP
jgi:hypothetical protein